MNRWIPTAAAVLIAAIFAVPGHSSLARTTAAAAAGTSTAACRMDRARRASTSAPAATTLLDCRWPRMAASSSTPPPRPGWCRCGLHDLSNGESRALPGTDGARDAVLVGATARRSGSSRTDSCARSISPAVSASDLADAPSARGGSLERAGDLVFAPSANGGLMRRDAQRIDQRASRRSMSASGETVACVAGVPARRQARDLPRHALAVVAIGDLDRVAR